MFSCLNTFFFFSRWEISGKSDCTNPCGAGERTLYMQCVQTYKKERKKVVVYEEACQHIQRPPGKENCTGMCDTTGWKYTAWGPVSGGLAYRVVHPRCTALVFESGVVLYSSTLEIIVILPLKE